ncbi:hypothetical protein T12_1297 [Trichinella patagoniensis]|uniref:Uncharacterized protein n=1 Tax=Trichinella patagoniensis TaxID=990121 RepID=A0A0V0ZDS2_9BILA|nr:hypothetical protein T12_1297 [Trichinella patagoniensis]
MKKRGQAKVSPSNPRSSRSPGPSQSRIRSRRNTSRSRSRSRSRGQSRSRSRGRNWNQSQNQTSYNSENRRLRRSKRQKAAKKRSGEELTEENEPSPLMCSRCLQLIRPRSASKNAHVNQGIQRKSWRRAATRRPVRSRRKSPTVTFRKSSLKECLIEVPKPQKKLDTAIKLQFTAKRCPLRHGRPIVGRRLFYDSDDSDENDQKET